MLYIVDVLFGKSNASATLNMLIILMKNFIYKQRVNNSIACFTGFMAYLKYHQQLKKNIFSKKKKIKNMIQKCDTAWSNCKLV